MSPDDTSRLLAGLIGLVAGLALALVMVALEARDRYRDAALDPECYVERAQWAE